MLTATMKEQEPINKQYKQYQKCPSINKYVIKVDD